MLNGVKQDCQAVNDCKFIQAIIDIDKRINAIQKDQSIINDDEFKQALKKAVDDVVNGEAKRKAAAKKARKAAEEQERKGNIHSYVSDLIQGMINGDVRKIGMGKGERYTNGSVQAIRDFLRVYDGFDTLHRYKFADIDNVFFNRWETYLIGKGLMKLTIRQFSAVLKRVMTRAEAILTTHFYGME